MRRNALSWGKRRHAGGLALVAVLWIVAALTIMVMSMAQSVRQEVRAVSGARQAVVGEARGQAAIALVAQDLAARVDKPQRLFTLEANFRDVPMQVRVQPLNGLIDLNNAPAGLLTLLFQHAGDIDKSRATALALAAVAHRSALDARGRAIGFEAPEDLLRVPGFDYPLYARLAGLVTADLRGSGRVNALAAEADVLSVLADGNAARAASLMAERDAGRPGIDTTGLQADYLEGIAHTSRYLLQARVPLPGGAWLLVARTVDFAATRSGVPWRILHSEHRFESAH